MRLAFDGRSHVHVASRAAWHGAGDARDFAASGASVHVTSVLEVTPTAYALTHRLTAKVAPRGTLTTDQLARYNVHLDGEATAGEPVFHKEWTATLPRAD